MSNVARLLTILFLVALGVGACSPGGGANASPQGSTGPDAASPSAPTSGIAHPTGAAEIVLRFDESGGFVPAEFLAAHVPYFTLYGDGTVVFVRTAAAASELAGNGPAVGQPIRTAKLTEQQVQDLLEFALTEGGLAIARADYQNPLVADAPTAVFELHADGGDKTVSVVALGMEGQPGPDTAILKALAALGQRLRDFDQGGSIASEPFVPAAYRAMIFESGGAAVAVKPWPWADIAPADFVAPNNPNGFERRAHVLTPAEAEAIGVEGFQNGIQSGLSVTGPDDVVYNLVLRPLLPDEQA